jgi:hypothetical protein
VNPHWVMSRPEHGRGSHQPAPVQARSVVSYGWRAPRSKGRCVPPGGASQGRVWHSRSWQQLTVPQAPAPRCRTGLNDRTKSRRRQPGGDKDSHSSWVAAQGAARDAVAQLMEDAERERERALMHRVEEALGTGGAGAAGLDEVLSTLEQQRAELLLIPQRWTLRAGLCPYCGRLSTGGKRNCRLDGAALSDVWTRLSTPSRKPPAGLRGWSS